ncbi:MAG: group III truncated hemoglobin [Thiovulaceae bacterium]|nr:group III truncated hemoglobin [Sulfurimonadaceae bacterium]
MYKEISEENMKKLVVHFYAKVTKNVDIGPFFTDRLGNNMGNDLWRQHLGLLRRFWSGMILGSGAYTGDPSAPLMRMETLSIESFQTWLKLFHETVDNVYDETSGEHLKQRSAMVAHNFMRNLKLI